MDKNCQIIPFQNLKNRMVQTDEAKAFNVSFFNVRNEIINLVSGKGIHPIDDHNEYSGN